MKENYKQSAGRHEMNYKHQQHLMEVQRSHSKFTGHIKIWCGRVG